MSASLHSKTIWLDLTEIQNDGYLALFRFAGDFL